MRAGKSTSGTVGVTGPVTVEIEGVTGPATFPDLAAAVGALWQSLRVLPLGSEQFEAYKVLLGGPDAVERVSEFLERSGRLDPTFTMSGRTHSVHVHLAEPGSASGR
ncbi:hypothetical protein [Kitasatospora sp. McL0602]|uniref:hypothetical protein n=1 Tax=Kitasatospora sp. McL0602 TaxID=3439530 RepID=UPI003F8C50A6